jgi:hypothetical protein
MCRVDERHRSASSLVSLVIEEVLRILAPQLTSVSRTEIVDTRWIVN